MSLFDRECQSAGLVAGADLQGGWGLDDAGERASEHVEQVGPCPGERDGISGPARLAEGRVDLPGIGEAFARIAKGGAERGEELGGDGLAGDAALGGEGLFDGGARSVGEAQVTRPEMGLRRASITTVPSLASRRAGAASSRLRWDSARPAAAIFRFIVASSPPLERALTVIP